MKKIIILIFLIVTFLFYPRDAFSIMTQSAPQTVSPGVIDDSWVSQNQPDDNFDSQNRIKVGVYTADGGRTYYDRVGLIKFGLSGIPLGSEIVSAVLTLKKVNVGANYQNSRVYLAGGSSWTETGVKWSNKPRYTIPYVERSGTASDRELFEVSPIVRQWITNRQANNGFYILGLSTTTSFLNEYYAHEVADQTPVLTIQYRPPASSPTPTPSPSSSIIPIQVINVDILRPTISNLTVLAEVRGANIMWRTDEESTSQVFYGTGGNLTMQTPLQTTRTSSHSVMLTNLTPSTTYTFKAASKDAAGNVGYSSLRTFTTLAEPAAEAVPVSNGANLPVNPGVLLTDEEDADTNIDPGVFSRFIPRSRNQGAAEDDRVAEDEQVAEDGQEAAVQPDQQAEGQDNQSLGQPQQPLQNVPIIGNLIKDLGNILANKLTNTALDKVAKQKEGTETGEDQSSQIKFDSKNPLVLIGSFIGFNRLVGILLIVIGVVAAIVALIIMKLTHKTYRHMIRFR